MTEGVELAVAYVSIVPEGSKIAPEVRKQFGAVGNEATKAGRSSGKRFGTGFSSGLKLLGGAALGGGIISFLKASNDEARESQKVGARTANVIKTTGGIANVSARQVGNLATAIGKKSGIDDEAVQSGANLLLTFKNVRNEVGKGNKVFDRATQAAVDLSASGFGDLNGASKQLGKALNDPVKGITALARSGVTFTDQQKDQIKTLVKSGHALDAQKIILKEVESQVGGAAAAQATAGDKLSFAYKNLQEQIGTALLPTIDKLATKLTDDFVPAISDFITGMQDGTGAGGRFADSVKNDLLPIAENLVSEGKQLYGALEPVLEVLNSLPAPVKSLGLTAGILGKQLGNLRTPLANGASGFERMGRGAANLAGGAGLLAIADAAKQTNPALAGLEGAAGGAALGLAVGGPLGAGLGFVAGGLIGVFSSGKKAVTGLDLAAEAAKQGTPTFSNYATTLNQVSGAITKATKAMVIQDLQQKGLLDTTRELGISDGEVFKGLTGGASARLKLKNDLRDATVQTEFFSDASDSSKVATLRNIQALQGLSGGLQKSQLELLQSNLLQAENKRQADLARGALEKYGRTHAIGTAELFGYTTVKKQVADLKSSLASLFNFAAKGEKAHPELNNHGTSLGDALGLDLLGGGGKKRRKHREFGGPVSRNVAYTVGERRPEVFVPNQSGRIVPKIAAASAVASSSSLSGARLTLHIAGRQIEGVLEEVADSRVNSAAALRGEQDRAFG